MNSYTYDHFASGSPADSPKRVVVTDCDLGPTDAEEGILRAAFGPGVQIVTAQCRTAADVLAVAREADALLVQWAPVTAEVIAGLDRCRVISRYGIGTDMIDRAAADARGIEVLNVPHYCTEEVGTHAVALLLALWRRLPQLDASVRAGDWSAPTVAGGVRRLSGSTLGLIGLGRIATVVANAFRSFGTRVVAFDPFVSHADGVELVDLNTLAEQADLISLHCPLTDTTQHLVDARFLRMVRSGAVLANTARGGLVDADALAGALHDGHLGGAGLDVFADEPLPPDDVLRTTPNTLLGAHAAWCSVEALPTLQAETAQNIVRYYTTANIAAREA